MKEVGDTARKMVFYEMFCLILDCFTYIYIYIYILCLLSGQGITTYINGTQ